MINQRRRCTYSLLWFDDRFGRIPFSQTWLLLCSHGEHLRCLLQCIPWVMHILESQRQPFQQLLRPHFIEVQDSPWFLHILRRILRLLILVFSIQDFLSILTSRPVIASLLTTSWLPWFMDIILCILILRCRTMRLLWLHIHLHCHQLTQHLLLHHRRHFLVLLFHLHLPWCHLLLLSQIPNPMFMLRA